MGEFGIECRIRDIATGRHVEIMHGDRIAQSGAFAEHRGDVAQSFLPQKIWTLKLSNGSRDNTTTP